MHRRLTLLITLAALVLGAGAPSALAEPATAVVMSALDNPRGLAFGKRDALYVAEAGVGGAQPCGAGPEGDVLFGRTGAVSRLLGGRQERISTGLPSLAASDGTGATGPHDIDFSGRNGLLTIGLGANPGGPGALIKVAPDGTRSTVLREGLVTPTGLAIGRDGDAYVANCGIFPGSGPYPCTGHVLKVDL